MVRKWYLFWCWYKNKKDRIHFFRTSPNFSDEQFMPNIPSACIAHRSELALRARLWPTVRVASFPTIELCARNKAILIQQAKYWLFKSFSSIFNLFIDLKTLNFISTQNLKQEYNFSVQINSRYNFSCTWRVLKSLHLVYES